MINDSELNTIVIYSGLVMMALIVVYSTINATFEKKHN